MTAELRDSLAQVQELLGRATFGVLRADGHKDWFQPTVMLHSGDDIVARYHHGAPDFTCTVGKYEYELRNAEAVEACVNFVMQHGPELMKMLDRHGAGAAEDAARYRWIVRRPKSKITIDSQWGDQRISFTTTDAESFIDSAREEAARAGERG